VHSSAMRATVRVEWARRDSSSARSATSAARSASFACTSASASQVRYRDVSRGTSSP
jgi:hypothetical protein